MAAKAAGSAADEVILDLEDSVAPSAKDTARAAVIEAIRTLDWGDKIVAFRPNGFTTEWAYRDIIEVVEGAGDRLEVMVIPKVNGPEEIHYADFIIIAGRPSMGKTAFALNIAKNAGVKLRRKVLVMSLEMSKEQLVQRLLCSEAKVNSQSVRTGYLEQRDWHRLTNAAGRLAEAPIFIDDTPALSVLEARAKARRMKAEHGLDLIVIDYLQLMRGRNVENRQQEISEISRSLKALAKELNVPVVALSQLSRAVEARQSKDYRPQLSDLRESGALEQDADVIIFLYRPERYGLQVEDGNVAEAIVGKQRNGPVGTVDLVFLPEFASFEDRASKFRSEPQAF